MASRTSAKRLKVKEMWLPDGQITATATQMNYVAPLGTSARGTGLAAVADAAGTVAFDRTPKVVKVALAALDTAGGVLAWANPEATAILVTRVILDVTTKSTGACTIDVGVAANGTTSNDTIMDALDIGTAAGTFDNVENQGTNGKAALKVAAGSYVTASMASGAAAGTVGFAYIEFFRI